MKKEVLKRIFDFLEGKGEHKGPFRFKLLNNVPLTKEELIVDDDLDLSYTNITSLPEGLKVYGDLHLDMTKFLKSLPKGLEVGGDLYIAKKYTDDEIREMIKPGFVLGRIIKI